MLAGRAGARSGAQLGGPKLQAPRPAVAQDGGEQLRVDDVALQQRLQLGDALDTPAAELPIVAALLERPLRYTEIQELLPGLAPNILSARLRALERDGRLSAERYSERPPRFQYRLTPSGRALREVAETLSAWAGRSEPPRHDACGGPLELRWWCAACESPAQADAGEEASVAA